MITRSFIHLKHAWYADENLKGADFVDEISIQVEKSGGLICEFNLRWFNLGDGKPPAPRLEVFNDAWAGFLEHFADFLQELGKRHSDASPDDIIAILNNLEIEDATPTESDSPERNPYEAK